MKPEILILKPDRPHLYGASQAQQDMAALVAQSAAQPEKEMLVVLDLSGVESVTGSYLRATVYWVQLCGKAHVQRSASAPSSDPWQPRPLALFPVVGNCSRLVAEEVDDYFAQRGSAIFEMIEGQLPKISLARVLGRLDPFLSATLRLLADNGSATAMQLAQLSSDRITVNGWSNRLSDLFALRLVTRQRSGKFWIYKPLTERITTWD